MSTLVYKESARAQQGGVFHLHFGFPLPFCQLACRTATLLSSFAKEQEIGHGQPSRNNPHRRIQTLVGVTIYLAHPRKHNNGWMPFVCRAGGEVKNPDPSDTTQGEGQYYEVVINRRMQSAEHKECEETEGESEAGYETG